jgi:hypothetical protein
MEAMQRMETNFTQTTNALQNRVVQMERNLQQNGFLLGMRGIMALPKIKDFPPHWNQLM